jgi:hypothetical protein
VLKGTCHCGSVEWTFDGMPDSATTCNCTVCRRYGALWIYDYEDERIRLTGETAAYVRGKALSFHFCPTCGCVVCWRSLKMEEGGRQRMAVNLRLTEPGPVEHLPIQHFDGLDTFEDLPVDHRCVKDHWF